MHTTNMKHDNNNLYSLQNFIPLIIIGTIIVLFTALKQYLYGISLPAAMYDCMGSFFVIFGSFKLYNLHGFVEAYRTYDIIAKRSVIYAYLYPFIELVLGFLYLTRFHLTAANWVTLCISAISSIGVAYELAQNKQIMCACLGAVFKIPMTYVTLAEDVLMGIMALIMLIA